MLCRCTPSGQVAGPEHFHPPKLFVNEVGIIAVCKSRLKYQGPLCPPHPMNTGHFESLVKAVSVKLLSMPKLDPEAWILSDI